MYRPSPKKDSVTEEIWESDSSGSDLNKKQLLTALFKKKEKSKNDAAEFIKKSYERGEG